MSGFIATPSMGDIDRLHRRIDSLALVVESQERRLEDLLIRLEGLAPTYDEILVLRNEKD